MSSLGQRLRAEHQSLDALFNDIADRVHLGETTDIDAGWSTLEATLLKHMDFEEREILPRLGSVDAREAETIREEHAQIRRTLTELGIAIELHILREHTVREFLGMLRAHAAREDRSLYPLVDNDAANATHP